MSSSLSRREFVKGSVAVALGGALLADDRCASAAAATASCIIIGEILGAVGGYRLSQAGWK
jgi:hypothetical protein